MMSQCSVKNLIDVDSIKEECIEIMKNITMIFAIIIKIIYYKASSPCP